MTRLTTALLLCLALASGIARAAPPETYAFLPLGEAWRSAQQQHKPMLLYFGRYGCTTCRKMHAEVFTDPDLQRRYSEDFVLAYVDTESGNRIRLANGERTTEMQFATRNRILGTTTFDFFSPELQPLVRKAGFQSIAHMRRYHGFITGGHYRDKTLADYSAGQ